MKWILITAEPDIARHASESGVHWIMLDMEVLGKAKRQGHLDTHKASHTLNDITAVREVVTSGELMVRVNPLHSGTPAEVEHVLARGAERLMLPMFDTDEDVAHFRSLVPRSVPITYLAETPSALVRVNTWMKRLHDDDEVHFGLNDLSLGMNLEFLFEVLGGGVLQGAARRLRQAGIPFGIGGVARPNVGELPANLIIGEHVRLGSSRAILSRAFHGSAKSLDELTSSFDLRRELQELHRIEDEWRSQPDAVLVENLDEIAERCHLIATAKRVPRRSVA
jgi:hypothetical protein